MNIRTSLIESRRQAKGTRFLWQYSDKWMTESRQEKLMVAGTDATDKPVLDTERAGKKYLGSPWSTERRNDWLQWISLASE